MSIPSGAPKYILHGGRDDSVPAAPVPGNNKPTHLPHLFTWAEDGPLKATFTSGADMIRRFGSKTFEERGPYVSHQTPFINTISSWANEILLQRVVPTDAPAPAAMQLAIEIVESEVPVYQRDSSGAILKDVNGVNLTAVGADPIEGYKVRVLLLPIPNPVETVLIDPSNPASGTKEVYLNPKHRLGQYGAPTQGTLVGTPGKVSTIYPIHEFKTPWIGSKGNLRGIILSHPTVNSGVPARLDVIEAVKSAMYRLQMVEKPDAKSTANVRQTLLGAQSVDFSYRPGAFNPALSQDLDVRDVLIQSYNDPDTNRFGPISEHFIYENNLETVLKYLFNAEKTARATLPTHLSSFSWENLDADEDFWMINFLTATGADNVPYFAVKVNSQGEDAVRISPDTKLMAKGGGNGTMTPEAFNILVRNICNNYGDDVEKGNTFLDELAWPQSALYDSGFDLETKMAVMFPVGLRKDIKAYICTQDVSQPANDMVAENSLLIALNARARLFPESVLYGTPNCRITIVGHVGELIGSKYSNIVPVLIEVAGWNARMQGAGNGKWARDVGFDMSPNNIITRLKNINLTWKPMSTYDNEWGMGMSHVRSFDTERYFIPAVQTAYPLPASVFNSDIFSSALVELEKICIRTWARLVGDSKSDPDVFIERSNNLILGELEDKFDDRFDFRVVTEFTTVDKALGYSTWTTSIAIYANTGKYIGSYTIIGDNKANL